MLQMHRNPRQARYNNNSHADDDQEEEEEEDGGDNGYFLEALSYPATGRPREFHMSIQEWMQDSSYSQLDGRYIATLMDIYDTDPVVKTASHIYQSSLFSGGVVFERPEAALSKDAAKWYDETWTKWAKDVDRHITTLGWVATSYLPHRQYVGEPKVINLTNCLILYKLDIYKQAHFCFFEQVSFNAKHGSWNLKYIENVIVYVDKPPETNGKMNTTISVLYNDILMTKTIFDTTLLALNKRANPLLVVETVLAPHDPEAIISTISPLLNGDEDEDMGRGSNSRATRARLEQEERKAYEYSKAASLLGGDGIEKINRIAAAQIAATIAKGVTEHHVGDGKKVANVHLPEGAYDLLITHRQAMNERVFNLFGIPIGMISQTSAFGENTSMNENAYTVFIYTQKTKKTQLINIMNNHYFMIYRIFHTLEKLTKASQRSKQKQLQNNDEESQEGTEGKGGKDESTDSIQEMTNDADRFQQEVGIQIKLTGLPDVSALCQLFTEGTLKYEAYTKYMGLIHCLDPEDFNEESEKERTEKDEKKMNVQQATNLTDAGYLDGEGLKQVIEHDNPHIDKKNINKRSSVSLDARLKINPMKKPEAKAKKQKTK